ncbi:MAG: hypothetical protein A3E19_02225 [Planctomycetes bacterium RIFCSPHIGHO2_12_FULL_52_36]|nr:MAG: hypothetical protein A3E19_02225 [Planctomycetes bacterium RIFCSPHIGHO2_12_FULL_52_36]
MERFLNIDRRIIFAAVALAVIGSLLVDFSLPVPATPPVQKIFDKIESLPPGAHFLLSFDYDPSSKEELQPMALALLHHCFRRGVKVIGMTHNPGGTGLAEQALNSTASIYQRKYKEDYVFLGYKPGGASLVINMGEDIHTAFLKDFYGNDTTTLPALQGVESLRDIDYLVDLAAGVTIETWIAFGKEKYQFEMGAGCTAVIGPEMYPFLDSRQINGLMAGLKGAAEYEVLVERKAQAFEGMRPQSVTHCLVILFVLFGNVAFFVSGSFRTQRRPRR